MNQKMFSNTWCSFTTCLSSRGKLTVLFVCHRRNYQHDRCLSAEDKIWSGQIRSGVLEGFDTIKSGVSFSLEDKHVVNEHLIIRKSHDTKHKTSSRDAFQCTTWLVWNELAASKTLLWRQQKNLWVSQSNGKSYIQWWSNFSSPSR